MPLQSGLSLGLVRVGIEFVPLEQLRGAENGVRGDVEIEILLDFRRGDVSVEPGDLADQVDLLGRELLVAARPRFVVDRFGLDVFFEEGGYGFARDLRWAATRIRWPIKRVQKSSRTLILSSARRVCAICLIRKLF